MIDKKIINLIFELGSARRIKRTHTPFTGISEDSISDHSFRVTFIALIIAKLEKADIYKTVLMSLCHDLPEIRTGDLNPLNKLYATVIEEKAIFDQVQDTPIEDDVTSLFNEYKNRVSLESIIVKDADLLDQIALEKELSERGIPYIEKWYQNQLKQIKLESSSQIAQMIISTSSFQWLDDLNEHFFK
ncbi:MAG: HD family hydrolase [Patescibacteria group bacterium]